MQQNKKDLWRFSLNRQYSVKPQIENHIKNLITDGELVPGEQLCSCEEVAKINSVSKNTVHRVYNTLAEKKVLESYWRKGTYVAEQGVQEAIEQYSLPAAFSFYELYKSSTLPEVYLSYHSNKGLSVDILKESLIMIDCFFPLKTHNPNSHNELH